MRCKTVSVSKKLPKRNELQVIYIRKSVHSKVKDFCVERGYKLGFFMEFVAMKYIAGQKLESLKEALK